MISQCANLCLIVAVVAQRCWCFLPDQLRNTPEKLVLPRVTCSPRWIRAEFGPQVQSQVHVKDLTGPGIPVLPSEDTCGVRVDRQKENNGFSFLSRYDSCYAQIQGSKVVIPLQVQLEGEDALFGVNISCPLIKRSGERTRPAPTMLPGNCGIEEALRVDCGHQGISRSACFKLGCCYDAYDLTCYYKLNACSLDGHLVFSVKATDTDPPSDPSSLIVKDHPHCFPVVTTPDAAVFKIGVMECGAKMNVEGDEMFYEVEVEEQQTESRTKYSPFRALSLQVPCEYKSSDLKRAANLQSRYAVTNPPPVVALGTIKVQMRIAHDASFTSFFPEDQFPLVMPLRSAAYVEISIGQPPPDPTLSLRVQDCFAYPASRHSVWTLLYDGCPNPLDKMRSSVPVDDQGRTMSHSQVRRFDVKTFAFLDPHTGDPSVEEMYFYCWVEICTNDVECAQRCAIISSEGDRHRREAPSESHQVQLVSLGPLRQNNTQLDENPCVTQNAKFQVTMYILGGVCGALLLILLYAVWSGFRKWRKPEVEQARDAQVDSEQSQ